MLSTIRKLRELVTKRGEGVPPAPGIEPARVAEPVQKAAPVPVETAKEAPDVNEYLEQVLSDFHKREVDQEENVARSLPFFGPSLAVTATLLGIVAKSLPTFSLTDWYPASIYFILAILAASILVMLCYLWTAVRPRRFKIPLTAEEFYDTYQSFKAFYEGQNLSVAQRNAALISDLRLGLIRNYAEVATTNQKHTLARLNARARAFQCLIVVLFLAFCLVGVIIVHDQVLTPPKSAEPAPYYGID